MMIVRLLLLLLLLLLLMLMPHLINMRSGIHRRRAVVKVQRYLTRHWN